MSAIFGHHFKPCRRTLPLTDPTIDEGAFKHSKVPVVARQSVPDRTVGAGHNGRHAHQLGRSRRVLLVPVLHLWGALSTLEAWAMHQTQQQLSQEMKDCIAACYACAQICNQCSDSMIGLHGAQAEMMQRCIRLCRECADICLQSAAWMSRVSELSERICQLCADVCDLCAEECARHAQHHALCGPCGQECRRCSEACRRMGMAKAA